MARRRSVNIPGFKHVNPIPNASAVGSLLMSGVVNGVDAATGELPATLQQQCENMFAHVRSILEAAGGSLDDVIKMTIWMKDVGDRAPLNEQWLKYFPDAASRPARYVLPHAGGGSSLILCDVTAVLQS